MPIFLKQMRKPAGTKFDCRDYDRGALQKELTVKKGIHFAVDIGEQTAAFGRKNDAERRRE